MLRKIGEHVRLSRIAGLALVCVAAAMILLPSTRAATVETGSTFHLAIEGDVNVQGLTQCTGIGSESDVERLKGGQAVPEQSVPTAIACQRGASSDRTLWDWRAQVDDGVAIVAVKKDVTLVLSDGEGQTVARWSLDGAWPSALEFVGKGELAVETVELTVDRVRRIAAS